MGERRMNASNSPQLADQLAQLRDIRLPQEVSWWPLAPGWWIALGIVLALALGAAIFIVLRRRTVKYVALRELERLSSQDAESASPEQLAVALSVLLRRVVLRLDLGKNLAQAHGDDWQSFLHAAPDGMPEAVARLIATAAYAPAAQTVDTTQQPEHPSRNALLDATRSWIRRHA
jgi:hypothetical protein